MAKNSYDIVFDLILLFIYGRLRNQRNRRWIAVKKLTKLAWPDAMQFEDEARGVGKPRHKRLANLFGYCCDGDERLLVAEVYAQRYPR